MEKRKIEAVLPALVLLSVLVISLAFYFNASVTGKVVDPNNPVVVARGASYSTQRYYTLSANLAGTGNGITFTLKFLGSCKNQVSGFVRKYKI